MWQIWFPNIIPVRQTDFRQEIRRKVCRLKYVSCSINRKQNRHDLHVLAYYKYHAINNIGDINNIYTETNINCTHQAIRETLWSVWGHCSRPQHPEASDRKVRTVFSETSDAPTTMESITLSPGLAKEKFGKCIVAPDEYAMHFIMLVDACHFADDFSLLFGMLQKEWRVNWKENI